MSTRYNDRNDDDRRGQRYGQGRYRYEDDETNERYQNRQRYRGYGSSEQERERGDVEDRDQRYGGYIGGYGRGDYNQSSGNYSRDYDESSRRSYGQSSGRDYDLSSERGYGQSAGRYGHYNESSGRYGRDYGDSSGRETDRSPHGFGRGYSEANEYAEPQRYNYPTGFRSGSSYDERGRTYDYDRGSYGATEGRGWGSRYGREEERGWDERGQGNERGWWDRASDAVASWFGDEDAERRRRLDQQHRGRGPKNYRRSDERIKEDVNDRLSDDYMLDASDVEVMVTNAEVLLLGTVTTRNDKRRAEDIADSVSGVSNVENRLRIKREGSSMGTLGQTQPTTTGTTGTTAASAAKAGTGTKSTGT